MIAQLRTAALVLLALTILTGGVYPLIVTTIAQLVFPTQATGSLIQHRERVTGSELIGQPFSQPEYFWGRLSATAPFPYNAAASSGSNLGPLHPLLKDAVEARLAALEAGGAARAAVPVDLVTASGSGLDPHISPAAAEFQVPRVAAARKMTTEAVFALVRQSTEGRQFGILGEPRVNVLRLNLALDQHLVN
ncbi:MAG: potassium-transporting ATPase subunit KdpC [Planctomycetaceae bacterium]|nr:potassium-transporting ATPase subunit KdpC [Planctomycetaceae bacterium]